MLPKVGTLKLMVFSIMLLHIMQYLKRYYLNNNGKGPIDFNDFDIRITNKHDDRYLKFKKIYNVAAVLFEHRPLVELKFILQHYPYIEWNTNLFGCQYTRIGNIFSY